MTKKSPRLAKTLPEKVKTALAEQTVTIAGTTAAETILPRLAKKLSRNPDHPKRHCAPHRIPVGGAPSHPAVLPSMPGVGARTAAQMLVNIGDIHDFKTPGHLASYAGLAPVTRRSGSSIRGEQLSRFGNRRLKNALFLSAFAALRADPTSRA